MSEVIIICQFEYGGYYKISVELPISGSSYSPSAHSTKILVWTSYAFSCLIVCFYCGLLTTHLTIDTTQQMESLEELVTSDYIVGSPVGDGISEIIEVIISHVCLYIKWNPISRSSDSVDVMIFCFY